MTRQRVADRGTECRVPLRCLLLDTDDFLETGRYSRVKAELRDNVEFCCDRWRVIIADKWDVELSIMDVCVLCLVMKILRIVALPCVHLFMFMRIEFGLLSFDWLAPSERRPSHPDYKAAYWEYWEQHWDLAEKWCPAEWLGRDLLQFMIGICSGHCRRRHWAASTFNCKLLVLASSSFVLWIPGGFWSLKSWMK